MNVLLSIKPNYAKAIINGSKQYEFRKSIFRKKSVRTVYMYSTAPVKRIVGLFIVKKIIEDHPKQLWDELKDVSGLDDTEFFGYFRESSKGFAIEIGSVQEFNKAVNPADIIPNFVPPQSFCYFDFDTADFGNMV